MDMFLLSTELVTIQSVYCDHTHLVYGAVLLEKLTGSQLVKKFPAFYGTVSSLLPSRVSATFYDLIVKPTG